MSESIQTGGSGRPTRTERVPVSCGECRRRKQKCNQGQPCSNCARRFPLPRCDYITIASRHDEETGSHPITTLSSSLLPAAFAGDEHVSIAGIAEALLPTATPQPQQQQSWSRADWEHFAGHSAPSPWADHWQGARVSSYGRDASASQQIESKACQPGCTIHSEAYHSAESLFGEIIAFPVRYVQQWRPEKTDEVLFWLRQQMAFENSSSDFANDRLTVPFQPTRQDALLLRIFVNFIARFKATLDGDADINASAYMARFVPFCLQSPLLIQTAIYTSACFLNEMEGKNSLIDNTTAVAHKFRALKMLNEHLQTHVSTTDEAISAVMQLMLNEWYWGDRDDLQAHSRGLRELIRLRGGFVNVGLGGLLAKLVIVSDIAIALSLETRPWLEGAPEFEYRDPTSVPFRVFLNTPLVSTLPPFATCAEPLHLRPDTAQILDDMRFLIGLVQALPPERPTEKDLQKVQTTSAWIHERICLLPEETWMVQQHRGSAGALRPVSADSSDRRGSSSGLSTRGKPTRHHNPSERPPLMNFQASDHSVVLGGTGQSQPATQDIMYQAIRQTALIYARAIMSRKPLGHPEVCSQDDFFLIWTTVWKIPFRSWKAVLGVFVWVMLSITPASRETQHSMFVKSLLTVGMTQMALEDWDVAEKGMRGALTFVAWLAGETGGSGAVSAVEEEKKEDSPFLRGT